MEATGPEVQVLAEVGLRTQEEHSAPVEQEAEAEQETQEEHSAPVEQEAEAEQEVRVVKVRPVGWGVVVKLEGLEGKVVLVEQGIAEVPERQEGQ